MLKYLVSRAIKRGLFIIALGASLHVGATDRLQVPALQSDKAADGLLLDVTYTGSRLVVVGDRGVILLSDDQGQIWRQANSPVSVMLTGLWFVDDKIGWAVGHDGVILKTLDGGENWTLQLEGKQLNSLRIAQFQTLVDAGGDSAVPDLPLDELELYLDDALIAEEEGPTQPFLDVWFSTPQEGWVLGAYGLLLKTTDGGEHWSIYSHRLPNPDRFHLNAILATRDGLFIAGEAGMLFRSLDQGEQWEALDSPYDGSFFALAEYQNHLLALGLRGHLFVSSDNGDSWDQISLATDASLTSGASVDNKLMLAGLGGLVLSGEGLQSLSVKSSADRRGWSAVAATLDSWVLVGEKGIKRLSIATGEVQP